MDHVITIGRFGTIDEWTARKFFKDRNIDHTYGIASSVCSLIKGPPSYANCKEIGIITMAELGLNEDKSFTFKDVLDASLDKGYSKITAYDTLNYLVSSSSTRLGPAVALMDEVMDGESDNGILFLRSDEHGFLRGVSFFTPDNSKKLSAKARFIVGKN